MTTRRFRGGWANQRCLLLVLLRQRGRHPLERDPYHQFVALCVAMSLLFASSSVAAITTNTQSDSTASK